ncbi:MAG: hypothetical protein LBJ44_02130 [Propionibacteriaceae bacterium]|jgi:hypothetical protein|nr:hypothetical protein [Propionibacteriaceae bacterium]
MGYSLGVADGNPDSFSMRTGCGEGVSSKECKERLRSPVLVEAHRDCRVEVPQFAEEYPVSEATFEFGLCLVGEGSAMVMDVWGNLGFADMICESAACVGFVGWPEVPVDLAAWDVCRARVPDFVPPPR